MGGWIRIGLLGLVAGVLAGLLLWPGEAGTLVVQRVEALPVAGMPSADVPADATVGAVPALPAARVPYTGPVEHIFFHPLIAFPDLAFDGDYLAQGYYDWFVTVPEFRRVIERLYANGYVLVDMGALFEERQENGRTVLARRELLLPPGKKPLIVSVDDVNYYTYMRENGNVFKLVLDDRGRVATYSVTPQGQPLTAYDHDIVPILDAFVATHPDFSVDGAKGVLALTGYEGILGYATHEPEAPGYEQEKAEALRVVQRLKETGWSFAAHGWGHQDAAKVSAATLERDTLRWKAEVEPLIGPTPVYIYPFGSGVLPGEPKFKLLQRLGFRVFAGVGPKPFLEVEAGYARMDRRRVDGLALAKQKHLLRDLFDPEGVLDPVRPQGVLSISTVRLSGAQLTAAPSASAINRTGTWVRLFSR